MIWWICHHSIGIIDIGNLSVDKLISNNVLGVCTKYGGHRSDFSFTRHEEKNNPVMVTLTVANSVCDENYQRKLSSSLQRVLKLH